MVARVDGIERIRFATSHPKDLSMDLIRAMKQIDKVCNHLHLPVQSGANAVLKRMNRKYDRDFYLSRIDALRNACPGISLSTDLIVGFPGETRKDFEQTMDLLKTIEFDAVFAFAYSARDFTPPQSSATRWMKRPKKTASMNFWHSRRPLRKKEPGLVGETVQVLVEGISPKPRDGFVKKPKIPGRCTAEVRPIKLFILQRIRPKFPTWSQ